MTPSPTPDTRHLTPLEAWTFPLPRTHTGLLQGNGTMGVMIWGEANVLRVTVNRGDFWDRRGGVPWEDGMSYEAIKSLLQAGDEAGLRALFEGRPIPPGQPRHPSLLPLGRIELVFPEACELTTGSIDLATGCVIVRLRAGYTEHEVTFDLAMDRPLLHVEIPVGLPQPEIRNVTAWDYVAEHLSSISFERPRPLGGPGGLNSEIGGWIQPRPADIPLAVVYRKQAHHLWLALEYGADEAPASSLIEAAQEAGVATFLDECHAWWAAYWETVPQLSLPDADLDFLYRYGVYKFAGLTNPAGVPAGLQGPWIEEYQMPPWSGDYHFNINVQMCYWPAYRGNRLAHLKPLFEMIAGWAPVLQRNAEIFCDAPDGLMLPHAVDDRCTNVGGFWTGTIDHGCTAWMGEMMYRYYQYSGDIEFLRATAYPFLKGALRVYLAMLERDGDKFSLPVSVSPEYRGAQMNAWGRNASFQLACIHYLCEALQSAAATLGEHPDPVWTQIQNGLPRAALVGEGGHRQIALWEGTPLEESHRHHSHLAGVYPFDTIALDEPEWFLICARSTENWVAKGMGLWSGWCISWASMLNTRFGNPDMAVLLLHIWKSVFTNEGGGTLHDCNFQGFTLIGAPWPTLNPQPRPEVMQMDAGMGVTTAIMELLLQTRRGTDHLFPGAPKSWGNVGFRGLRTTGGFLISASRERGAVSFLEVRATVAGAYRIANPWPGQTVHSDGPGQTMLLGEVLEVVLAAGETAVLQPAS